MTRDTPVAATVITGPRASAARPGPAPILAIATEPVPFFRNYTQVGAKLPKPLWLAARAAALAVAVALVVLLIWQPALGLTVFWGIAIPVLPALLVIAPGLWRQICPMATLNQLPRSLGLSRARELPAVLKERAFAIALVLFITAVALRQPLLNQDGLVTGAVVGTALLLALAGGLWFKGRSGWCGTFCPLGPIQRTYGQAPLVLVRNGYCEPCVGCQKNCYDFNPRAAVFSDIYDDDPRHAAQRRLFMGLLPGLLLGYFLAQPLGLTDGGSRLALLLGATGATAGAHGLAAAFLPINAYRISLAFGAAAIAIFYFFAGPILVTSVAQLLEAAAADWMVELSRGSGLLLAGALAAAGLHAERRYRAADAARGEASATGMASMADVRSRIGSARSLKDRLAESDAAEVTDRETGITFQAAADATLLESIERAGLKISYGCRAGVCGADPVVICEGAEHLSAPGPDELATLRRLGLEGRARLACMCAVSGPLVIDRDASSAAASAASAVDLEPAVDRAEGTGVSRVVIVGNGITGMSVAEGLRRGSASLELTVVANEPHRFYNRMGIGRLIYDSDGMESLHLAPADWAQTHRVTVLPATVAAQIDREQRRLGLVGGNWLDYDRLVLATGGRASLPEAAFMDHPNAFVLRTAEDADSIREYVQRTRARRAVVVGGGVLGVEAADALHKLGLRVTLLHRADRLMNAQLDERGAAILTSYLEGIGIQVATGVTVARYDGTPELSSAWLSHGPRVRADLFVACLGIQPNVHLAEHAGLTIESGIAVDAQMRSSDPNILAAGDCAELAGAPRGLWPIGAGQASVVVEAIFGGAGQFSGGAQLVQLKCDGIDVRCAGELAVRGGDETLEARGSSESWWRITLREGRVVGGLFVGPPGSSKTFVRLVHEAQPLGPEVRTALTGGDLAGAGKLLSRG